ncbi:MAG: hypothetical protein ABIF17_05300 [Patescibacteria group bacterium]
MLKKNLNKTKTKKVDLIILVLCPVIACILSFLLNADALVSIALFLGLPATYLSYKAKKLIKKTAFFSLIVSVPAIVIIEYIANITNTWGVLRPTIQIKLLGVVTIDAILWAICLVYYVVIFYEYFLDKHADKKIYRPFMRYLEILLLLGLWFFTLLLLTAPTILNIPYFYFSFGIILIFIPLIICLFKYPNLLKKFLQTGLYFFFVTFIYEITSIKLGIIQFPGNEFIGWVNCLGTSFPLEELFFWCILFSMAILAYYEFFNDDRK